MILPVHSTVPPSDLAGQDNGDLDLSLLVSIGTPAARLHHTVARGWFALRDAARDAGGWTLTWTSSADTYRAYAVQLTTFLIRYQPVTKKTYDNTPFERRKQWASALQLGHSSIYWIKQNFGTPAKPMYPATAAVPGTSPHGMGCAIDGCFPGPVSWTPALPWLVAHAHLYGFAWSLQSEPWHIQWVMGDAIPQAVLDYENPPLPVPIPNRKMIDMYGISYKLDRWPGPHLDRVGLDSIEHVQDGNSWQIDQSVGGMPVKELTRDEYVAMLSDRGRRHVSIAPDGSNTQDPFGAEYEGGAFADIELSAKWRAQQRD